MYKYLFFLFLVTLGISSCNCSYSYGVYVENATGEKLTIAFKTVQSNSEEKVILSPGEKKYIIENVAFQPKGDCTGTAAEHCKFIAEYVHGFLRDTIQSDIKWCDQTITFEKTDIQEGEFIIKYTTDDFF